MVHTTPVEFDHHSLQLRDLVVEREEDDASRHGDIVHVDRTDGEARTMRV